MNKQPAKQSITAITKLINVVAKLRDPVQGCPWDIKQNHQSLIPYAIEEAHEVADAIRYGNDKNLCDELGDLLLQVVMHSQIASEENRFNFEDVANSATEKMIRRHPHVFQKEADLSLKQVEESWEKIKQKEQEVDRSKYSFYQNLKRKLRSKSSFSGAMYISEKVIDKGIDLNDYQGIWRKVRKDLKMLEKEVRLNNELIAQNKIGDLLFSIIYISVLNKLDSNEGLEGKNKKLLNNVKSYESGLIENQFKESKNKQLGSLLTQVKEYILGKNY